MENQTDELTERGVKARQSGNPAEALQLYEKAIELNDGSPTDLAKAHYNKGVLCELDLKDLEQAFSEYRHASQLDPNHRFVWNNLGHVLIALGQFPEALNALETAIELNAEDYFAWVNKACTLNRMGQFPNAIALLNDIKDRITDENLLAKLHSELGVAFLQTQQVVEAKTHLETAYQLNPDDYQTTYNLGFIFDGMKDYDKAIEFYDAAIRIDQTEGKAYQGKACTFIHKKECEEALLWIEKALSIMPTNFETHYNHACIHAGLNQKEKMIAAVKETVRLAPPQIGIANYLRNDSDFASFHDDPDFIDALK